tara:strand:- start:722 stop:1630 length:909 start_codon:yes stop_codon:yes gene_type:complete
MAGHDTSFFSQGLDTSTGNRNLDLGALYSDLIKKNAEKVVDDDIKIPTTYKELVDFYGGKDNIPDSLKTQLGDIQPNVPEGFKLTKRFGKDVLVPEDALANREGRTFAGALLGVLDEGTYNLFDFDRYGKEPKQKAGVFEKIDLDDPANLKLSQGQQKAIEKSFIDTYGKVPSPTAGLDDALESINKFQDNQDKRQINKARRMGIEAFGNYALTEIPRQMFINRAEEIANQRFLRTKFALEATPTKIQDIMTAKQAQQGIAALSEAERAKAVAEQQKAANEFGAPQVTLARNVRFANASFKA